MSGGGDGCGAPGVCYPCCKRSWNQLDDCNPSQDWQTLASPLATARNIPCLQTPHNLRQVFAIGGGWRSGIRSKSPGRRLPFWAQSPGFPRRRPGFIFSIPHSSRSRSRLCRKAYCTFNTGDLSKYSLHLMPIESSALLSSSLLNCV